jgi:hypothetical protein
MEVTWKAYESDLCSLGVLVQLSREHGVGEMMRRIVFICSRAERGQ